MKVYVLMFLLLTPLLSRGVRHEDEVDSVAYDLNKAGSDVEKVKILNQTSASLTDADLKRSFSYASQALALALTIGDRSGQATALINQGKYHTRSGRFETAMQKYLDAMKISEELSDHKSVALIHKIIGNGYYFQGEYTQALKQYRRALKMNATIRDVETSADLENNIALIFIEQGKLDSAMLFLTTASKSYAHLKLDGKLANTFLNLGDVKAASGQHDAAIAYYEKALRIDQRLGLQLQEAVALNDIASSLITLQRYDRAKPTLDAANKIVREQNFRSQSASVLQTYYELAKAQNDYKLALTYHEALLALKDSLLTADKIKQIEDVRTKYESEQTEKQNQKLTAAVALNESQLLVQRGLISFTAVFAIGVSIMAINYYRLMMRNKKTKDQLILLNRQIHDQKEELSAQAEKLASANKEITAMNEDLESRVQTKMSEILEQHEKLIAYSYHNSHQVRGPLARILGLVQLLRTNLVAPDEVDFIIDKLSIASKELDTVIKEINAILQVEEIRQ